MSGGHGVKEIVTDKIRGPEDSLCQSRRSSNCGHEEVRIAPSKEKAERRHSADEHATRLLLAGERHGSSGSQPMGHRGEQKANKIAKETVEMIGPFNKAPIRYLSAVSSLLKSPLKASWDFRWNGGGKGRYTYRLTPQPTLATRMLYAGLSKGQGAVLAKLRTGKTGFNAFLYERRVPTVLSPRCTCDLGTMTVHHILLVCPTWASLRSRYPAELKTPGIRKILNSAEGSKTAVRFTLATMLLP